MDFIIEEVSVEDAAALLEYIKTVGGETDYLTFGEEGVPYNVGQEIQYILQMVFSEKDVVFLAKVDGEIVGDCNFTSERPSRIAHRGELGMSVLKKYWGMGIGTALLQKTIDYVKNVAKAEVISLEVRADNDRAISLYEKFGFESFGTYKKYFKVGDQYFDAVYMNLYL